MLRHPVVIACLCAALSGCANAPQRTADAAQPHCQPAPWGTTTLYLRGSMSSWAALDDYAFVYQCDAYLLNVDLPARGDFKIADAAWTATATWGAAPGEEGALTANQPYRPSRAADTASTGNLSFVFNGEHTIELRPGPGGASITIGAKRFADPRAAPLADPVALSLQFDSRDLAFKRPFGAVVPGTPIRYVLGARPGVSAATLVIEDRQLDGNQDVLTYTERVRIPMQHTAHADGGVRWSAEFTPDRIGVYGYWFEVTIGAQQFVYQNNRDAIFWTRERGSGGRGVASAMPASHATIRRFRQTVHAADFQVPAWAPDLVYYYIFPDRFRNGDRRNDPVAGRSRFRDGTVEFHTNWNDRPWLAGTGDGSDAHYSNDFFGGDLAGIIEKLDDLQELGINALYLTPIFQASSNHKYDTADYHRIDPAFGTQLQFEQLTAYAAQRGIRVIVDTSLNHSGNDSIYFDRFSAFAGTGAFEGGRIHPESPYASWYRFDASQADPQRQYQGWTGVADLPELDKAAPGFRRFAFGEPDGVMQHWLDAGASGWRMDVAPWVPDDFWRQWRSAVKQHRPDAITIAETWFDASKHLLGDMFDSTMNYIFRNTVLEYAGGGNAERLYANIEHLREAYPRQAFYAAMNLLSTHDQARSLHVLGMHSGETDPAVMDLAKRRYSLAVLFQLTFPGSPAIFYGDEVGVTGGDDPFNRATYPWPDRGGTPDLAMRAEFKALLGLRNAHAVLRRGSIDAPVYLDQHVIVLLRRMDQQTAIVALNNSADRQRITIELPADLSDRVFHDARSGGSEIARSTQLAIEIPAIGGRVLLGQSAIP